MQLPAIMGSKGDDRTAAGHGRIQLSPDCEHSGVFPTRLVADGGGWIIEIVLGDGATVSKWFPDAESARRYPLDLQIWLESKRTDDGR